MGALTRLRRRGARKLYGSTLIETIVASVIFMCVFAISLETVSRLTAGGGDTAVLIEADHRIGECLRDYAGRENGLYTREYGWGGITVLLRPYRNLTGLREMVITADIASIRKRLELRHVVEE